MTAPPVPEGHGAQPPWTPPSAPQRRRPLGRTGRLSGVQLVLGVVVFLVAELVMSLLALLGTLVVHGALLPDTLLGVDPAILLVGAVVGAAIAIGGHLLIVGPLGQRPGQALAGRGKLAELACGLLVGAALVALSVGIVALLGGYRVTGIQARPDLLTPLAIGIGAGFIEEVFFRGALLRLIDGWLGSWAAIAITSVIFGLMHVTNDGAGLLGGVALVIEAGVLLGGAYLVTRRLWLAIGIHISWNVVQSAVFSSSVSGTGAQRGLLLGEFVGPQWLSGGAMGIEGSVVTIVVGLAAGIVLLVLAQRRGNLLPRDRAGALAGGPGLSPGGGPAGPPR